MLTGLLRRGDSPKARGKVGRQILVPFLEPIVLLYVVKIVTPGDRQTSKGNQTGRKGNHGNTTFMLFRQSDNMNKQGNHGNITFMPIRQSRGTR